MQMLQASLMRQRKFILIVLFQLLTNFLFGQIIVPTKNQLLKIFKESILEKKKNYTTSNPWIACNRDSLFFKSDTIQLVDNESYYHYSVDCCSFVEWAFSSKDKFTQSKTQVCNEPASATVLNVNDTYKISLAVVGHDLIMTTTNSIDLTQKYKVLSIDKTKIDTSQNLTISINLLRIR
jgi:hypothetical protein